MVLSKTEKIDLTRIYFQKNFLYFFEELFS